MGDIEKAIEEFKQKQIDVYKADPQRIVRDTRGAEQHFRLALKSSPGYVQAWIALAATLATESRTSDALQAVDTALKIDPGNSEGLELRKNLVAGQAQH